MLQRGRGAGFLQARDTPTSQVEALLWECLTHDPRWDHQLEARAEYYAQIALQSGIGMEPLARWLKENDDPDDSGSRSWLAVSTFGALAQRGDRHAVGVLRAYLEWGQHRDIALPALLEVTDPAAWTGLDAWLLATYPNDDELNDAVGYELKPREPWTAWCEVHPRFAQLRGRQAQPVIRRSPDEAVKPYLDRTVAELFRDATMSECHYMGRAVAEIATPGDLPFILSWLSPDDPVRCRLALSSLERLASPAAWPALRDFALRYPEPRLVLRLILTRALCALPADLILEDARLWFDHGEWHLRRLGHKILSGHATRDDLDRLRGAVPESLESDDMYRLCAVLEALARVGDASALPQLEMAFVEAPYSWARRRAAEAMIAVAPKHFTHAFSFECLWDAERELRVLGCRAADRSRPEVRERLTSLASDPLEENHVRSAASAAETPLQE